MIDGSSPLRTSHLDMSMSRVHGEVRSTPSSRSSPLRTSHLDMSMSRVHGEVRSTPSSRSSPLRTTCGRSAGEIVDLHTSARCRAVLAAASHTCGRSAGEIVDLHTSARCRAVLAAASHTCGRSAQGLRRVHRIMRAHRTTCRRRCSTTDVVKDYDECTESCALIGRRADVVARRPMWSRTTTSAGGQPGRRPFPVGLCTGRRRAFGSQLSAAASPAAGPSRSACAPDGDGRSAASSVRRPARPHGAFSLPGLTLPSLNIPAATTPSQHHVRRLQPARVDVAVVEHPGRHHTQPTSRTAPSACPSGIG